MSERLITDLMIECQKHCKDAEIAAHAAMVVHEVAKQAHERSKKFFAEQAISIGKGPREVKLWESKKKIIAQLAKKSSVEGFSQVGMDAMKELTADIAKPSSKEEQEEQKIRSNKIFQNFKSLGLCNLSGFKSRHFINSTKVRKAFPDCFAGGGEIETKMIPTFPYFTGRDVRETIAEEVRRELDYEFGDGDGILEHPGFIGGANNTKDICHIIPWDFIAKFFLTRVHELLQVDTSNLGEQTRIVTAMVALELLVSNGDQAFPAEKCFQNLQTINSISAFAEHLGNLGSTRNNLFQGDRSTNRSIGNKFDVHTDDKDNIKHEYGEEIKGLLYMEAVDPVCSSKDSCFPILRKTRIMVKNDQFLTDELGSIVKGKKCYFVLKSSGGKFSTDKTQADIVFAEKTL